MKKFFLSGFVIVTFILYSLSQKSDNLSESAPVALPISSKGNNPGSSSGLSSNNKPVKYKDGAYTGDSADAYYGNIKVKVVIQDGKITDVQFLDYPHDRRASVEINTQAMPMLKSEAIQAQNANVDTVSGATATSQAFIQSLQSALVKAQG